MKKLWFLFFCFFCSVGLVFAEKDNKLNYSLTKLQKKQIKAFVLMQKSMLNTPDKTDALVKDFFELIAEEMPKTYAVYEKTAQRLKEHSEKMLSEGKVKAVEKSISILPYYSDIAKASKQMIKYYEKYDKYKFKKAMNLYLETEKKMKQKRLKIIEREWLSLDELKIIINQYKKGNHEKKD